MTNVWTLCVRDCYADVNVVIELVAWVIEKEIVVNSVSLWTLDPIQCAAATPQTEAIPTKNNGSQQTMQLLAII